jgi:hypothetical protein
MIQLQCIDSYEEQARDFLLMDDNQVIGRIDKKALSAVELSLLQESEETVYLFMPQDTEGRGYELLIVVHENDYTIPLTEGKTLFMKNKHNPKLYG